MNTTVTAQELVDFLKTSPPKGAGQFETADGKCCLGHYATLCEMTYSPSQGAFYDATPLDPLVAVLPDSHWIMSHQFHLACLNDNDETFGKAIQYLERVVLAGEDRDVVFGQLEDEMEPA